MTIVKSNNVGSALFYYSGSFTSKDVNKVLMNARKALKEVHPAGFRKVFPVVVELVYNIRSYSLDAEQMAVAFPEDTPEGTIEIREDNDGFAIKAQNYTTSVNAGRLKYRLKKINKLDKEALLDLKRTYLRLAVAEDRESGNYGLVQIAITSNSNIHFEEDRQSQKHTLVGLEVYIKKS
jgi:hypothetical protein